jgi:ankyrin repeat protein
MKFLKLFEDFKVEDIPQTEPQFTLWMIKNAPKAVTNPQEWFESEMAKPEPDWAYIGFIIKELGLANRLSIPKGAKEELELDYIKDWVDSLSLLHWAVFERDIKLITILIDAGADLNAKDYRNETPLLQYTIRAGQVYDNSIPKILIEAGANLDMQNERGDTSLHLAIKRGNRKLSKMLIESGANLDVQNNSNYTPLHLAILEEMSDLAKEIIESGANLDLQDEFGDTPLHIVCVETNPELAKVLIDAGANLNMENENTFTPLHLAIRRHNVSIAQMLIQAGANVKIRAVDGKTPWDLANPQIREALPELNPNGESL